MYLDLSTCSGNYYRNGSLLPTPPNLLYGSVLYNPLGGSATLQPGSQNIVSANGYGPTDLGIFKIIYSDTGVVPIITLTYGPEGQFLSTTTVSLIDTSPNLANISINPIPASNVYIQIFGVYPQ